MSEAWTISTPAMAWSDLVKRLRRVAPEAARKGEMLRLRARNRGRRRAHRDGRLDVRTSVRHLVGSEGTGPRSPALRTRPRLVAVRCRCPPRNQREASGSPSATGAVRSIPSHAALCSKPLRSTLPRSNTL